MYRAPADVVTGFLGSGKTTLVRRLLAAPEGRRVALVVNELAGIDVDGRVARGFGAVERALELPGGCICCEVREARFARAIDDLVRRVQPDLVVVETSGVAEPGPTVERLREAGLSIDAVIALVDAEHARETLRAQAIARAQVAGADFLVLNRTDLVAPDALAPLARLLRAQNERALIVPTVRADVELDLLFATGAARLRAASSVARSSTAAAGEATAGERAASHGLTARVFRRDAAVSRRRLERVLGDLPEAVHRSKGIARVADSALALLFNGVRRRVELEWLPFGAADTQAVVIGEGLDALWPEIERALVACLEPDVRPGEGAGGIDPNGGDARDGSGDSRDRSGGRPRAHRPRGPDERSRA